MTLFLLLGYNITWLEIVASVISLVSIALLSKVKIWNWPLSIISSSLFMVLFFQIGLYANSILQIYFILVSIFGWINWKKQGDKLKIHWLDKKYRLILIPLILISIPILIHFNTHSPYPILDSSITILSVVASYLMSKKIIDSWFIWIIVDVMCIYLYYMSGIHLISFEYIIILGMAFYGVRKWIKIEYGQKVDLYI